MVVIPSALQPCAVLPLWVVWKYEPSKKGKPTKVPYQAKAPTEKASTSDPSTWADAATAISTFEKYKFDGIGICITATNLVAFDVDDCRNPDTGVIDPWVMDLIKKSGTYSEITPSGKGLRLIGTGSGGNLLRKQKVPAAPGVSLETYRKCNKYITVTNQHLEGTPKTLADISALADATVAELDIANGISSGTKDDKKAAAELNIEVIAVDDPRLAILAANWIELGTQGTGITEKYSGDRSRAAMAFACECFRHTIPEDVIASCMMHWKIGEHVRDQADVPRALRRLLTQAREFVADSKLFKMNEKFCVLPIGGKTRVVTWGDDPDFPGHQIITMTSPMGDFKTLHDKYRHSFQDDKGKTVIVKLGSWWINNSGRRQYDGGWKFAPTHDSDVVDGNVLNLWQGFRVAARKPEGMSGARGCQLLLDHGKKIICSNDEEHYDYLIKREALIAQQRIRSEIGLGLRTEEEGTGKGVWCGSINYLYGNHAMEVQNPEHVVGKHNPHLEKLLRLTADEALFAQNPLHRNSLYNLITEPRITIEPKFVNAYPANNHLNIDVISNAEHFLPVSGFARRFFVPKVSSEHANDHDYFRAILKQLNDGGYQALLYHLLHEVDVRDFNVRAVPKTASLAEQAALSRKGIDLLVETACATAVAPCQHMDLPGVSSTRGYQDRMGFDYFIDHHSDRDLQRMGSLKVKRELAKHWGCVTGKAARTQQDGKQVNCILWLPLTELRTRFEAKHGKQEWLIDAQEWKKEGM